MSRRVLWGLFCKGANLIHEGSTLMTYHLPKAPPPNTITLNIQHMNLGGGRGTQTFCHHQEGWVGELRPACGEPSPAHGVCLGRLLSLSSRGKTAKGLQGPQLAPNKHQMDMLLSILFSVNTEQEFCTCPPTCPPTLCPVRPLLYLSDLGPLDRGVRDVCGFGSHSSIFLFADLEPNMVFFMYGSRWALNLLDPISLHIQGRQDSFVDNFSRSCRGTLANSIKFPLPPSQGLALGSRCLGSGGETEPVVPTTALSSYRLR